MKRMSSKKLLSSFVVATALVCWSPPARAVDIWASDDGMQIIELTTSLKIFGFGSTGLLAGPEGFEELFGEPWPYPDFGGGALMRLRLRFLADITSRIRFGVHYEQRPRVLSHGRLLSAAAGSLQGDEGVPLRLHPLQWEIAATDVETSLLDGELGAAGSTFAWEHEIDRLFMSFAIPGGMDLTIGRQAMSWGVCRLWSPLDLFAPLTATDLDREERRGIDAARLTLALSPTSFLEVVVAGGYHLDEDGEEVITWDDSSLAWMLRINQWGIDWLLVAGKVGTDRIVGGAIEGQIRGVAVRGEMTSVTDEQNDTNIRATVGLEFGTSFDLSGTIEYHYNGFGVSSVNDYGGLLFGNDAFVDRLSRGQVAGLAQHYAGLTLVYRPHPLFVISLVYIQNLIDGSLTLSPSVMYSVSDEVSISIAGIIPIGRDSTWNTESGLDLDLRSEFGFSPQLYVIQLRAAI